MTIAAGIRSWPAEGLTRVPYWVYSDRAVYDGDVLDASLLLMPLVKLVAPADERTGTGERGGNRRPIDVLGRGDSTDRDDEEKTEGTPE